MWQNADAFFVIVVGVVVAILEVVGDPSAETVNAAILGLLAATAIVLLRNRVRRGELDDVRQLAGDAISDRPYEVVWQNKHWDLLDREKTTIRLTEQLRFTRNDVATIAHWSQGDGRDTENVARWRREKGSRWIEAKKIYEFPTRGGSKVIYCLDEEHSRGDMLEWHIERDAVGRFPTDHESVSIQARTKSDHPRIMRITWPNGSPPSHVELKHERRPARTLVPTETNGRAHIEEKVPGLEVGERVTIAWRW